MPVDLDESRTVMNRFWSTSTKTVMNSCPAVKSVAYEYIKEIALLFCF